MRGQLKHLVIEKLAIQSLSGSQLIESIFNDFNWKVSFGSMYPLLKSLEDENLVISKKEGKSKIYRLTKSGNIWLDKVRNDRKNVLADLSRHYKLLEEVWGLDLSLEKIFLTKLAKGECMSRDFNESMQNFRFEFKRLLENNFDSNKELKLKKIFDETTNKMRKIK